MQAVNFDQIWLNIFSESNELQRRHLAGFKALELGWGGISKICRLTGLSHHTIDRGIREIQNGKAINSGRIRKAGGGRKKIVENNPDIITNLKKILEKNTAGDPMHFLVWTNKSLSNISDELKKMKHNISRYTVRRILLKEGYTLQSNKKSKEHCNSPESDSQFKFINSQIESFSLNYR